METGQLSQIPCCVLAMFEELDGSGDSDSNFEFPYSEDLSVVTFSEEYEEKRSIVFDMLRQLAWGTDLAHVSFPIFVLEPRSLLERISDFMSHPHLILHFEQHDEIGRFLCVMKYFLSSWHIRPPGVKKPYNPVQGEYFACYWNVVNPTEDCPCCQKGSRSYFLSEQVSHYPPISAYFYCNPDHEILIQGNFRPKGRFLGNSVASINLGSSTFYSGKRPEEVYTLTNPNMYVRGLFIGRVLTELGDTVRIECRHTGFYADIEFKVKGYFFGDYNSISGKIRKMTGDAPRPSKDPALFKVFGKWTDGMFYESIQEPKNPQNLIDVRDLNPVPKSRVSTKRTFESINLWRKVTKAIMAKNPTEATNERVILEDLQRKRIQKLGQLIADPESAKALASKLYPGTEFGNGVPLTTRFFTSTDAVVWKWRWTESKNLEKTCVRLLKEESDPLGDMYENLLADNE